MPFLTQESAAEDWRDALLPVMAMLLQCWDLGVKKIPFSNCCSSPLWHFKEILSVWHGRVPKLFLLRGLLYASNEYYSITERNQKLKCLRVQLIYPNRKCFLKNYGTIFTTNLSQTHNWINGMCSFKTNLFFWSWARNSLLAFIHQVVLHLPPIFVWRDLSVMGFLLGDIGLKHSQGWKVDVSITASLWFLSLFNKTMNKARKYLKGARSDGGEPP